MLIRLNEFSIKWGLKQSLIKSPGAVNILINEIIKCNSITRISKYNQIKNHCVYSD